MHGMMSRELMLAYFFRAVVMLIAIPAHEAAHAWVSYRLGDDTAKRAGRLSLNPLAHFDPLGAICMIFVGVGWAKPVGINPYRFRNPKKGMALSAAAGPLCNLVLAFFSLIFYKLIYYLAPVTTFWQLAFNFFYFMVLLNINLAVFNLLPVPPWDGSRIVWAVLPQQTYFKIMQYERYIFVGFFVLLMLGFLDGPLMAMNNLVWGLMDHLTGFVELTLNAMLHTGGVAV